MPEITIIHIALAALAGLVAAIIGWVIRGQRAVHEKLAINSSWQEQIDSHETERQRLIRQNKELMVRVSDLRASREEAEKRARVLAAAAQSASTRRDDLQREIRKVRNTLEVTLTERDQLQSDRATQDGAPEETLQKDETIARLSRELENWQKRLPPLIERYRSRNLEAQRLEADLAAARLEIEQLERVRRDEAPHDEPVRNPEPQAERRGESNEQLEIGLDHQARPRSVSGADRQRSLRDDLQKIKGVGPSIEKTLNELGIFRYQQIADMSDYDVGRVARKLSGFRGRIDRENWIGQARELCDGS